MLNDMTAKAIEIIFMAENGFVVKEDYKSKEEHFKEARFYLLAKKIIQKDRNRANYFSDDFWQAKLRSEKIRTALKEGHVFYQVKDTAVLEAEKVEDGKMQRNELMQQGFSSWFEAGTGLNIGDTFKGPMDLEQIESFNKKRVRSEFISLLTDDKKKSNNMIFIAQTDINYGFVVNCYYAKQTVYLASARPFACFKYFSNIGKVKKIDPAAFDVLCAGYNLKVMRAEDGLKKVHSLKRPFKTKVKARGVVSVSFPEVFKPPFNVLRLSLPLDKVTEREEVVLLVEDDPNHKQVIKCYRERDYNSKEPIAPLAVFKYYEGLKYKGSNVSQAIAVDLAMLDIIKAYHGEELKVFGRQLKLNIQKRPDGTGFCRCTFLRKTEYAEDIILPILPEKMKSFKGGEKAIARVEEDINHGQVINIYSKTDSSQEKPDGADICAELIGSKIKISDRTQRYLKEHKNGISLAVDIKKADILACAEGRRDINPRPDGEVERNVLEKRGKFYVRMFKISNPKSEVEFELLPVADEIFSRGKKGQKAYLRIKKDPDYGSFIEVFKGNTVLAQYYYSEEFKECRYADFSKKAFMDFILGEKNIYGKRVASREYCPLMEITSQGSIRLISENKELYIYRLRRLKGLKPVFVPRTDKKYGYKINLHDMDAYAKNKWREPDMVLVRNAYYKTLVPIEKAELAKAKELMERGFYFLSIKLSSEYSKENPKNTEAKEIFKTADNEDRRIKNSLKYATKKNLLSQQTEDLFDLCKALAGDTSEVSFEIVKILIKALDFKSILAEKISNNLDILEIFTELPCQYKTESMINKTVDFLCYKGERSEEIIEAGLDFFRSIPEELLHKPKTVSEIGDNDIFKAMQESKEGIDPFKLFKRDMSKHPLLTKVGEITLSALTLFGDRTSEEQFVNSNLRLISGLAKKYALKSGFEYDELYCAGNEALIKAVRGYKPWKGYKFSTYAVRVIIQNIERYIMNNCDPSRIPEFVQRNIKQLIAKCYEKKIDIYDIALDSDLIAEKIGEDPGYVDGLRKIMFCKKNIALDDVGNVEDGDEAFGDRMLGIENSGFGNIELELALKKVTVKVLEPLKERWPDDAERLENIFFKRFIPRLNPLIGDGKTLEALGEEHGGVTREAIRQAEKKIYTIFREQGFTIDDFTVQNGKDVFFNGKGSPSEALRVICEKFITEELEFEKFNKKKELYPLRRPYSDGTIDLEVRILRKLNILIMTKPGVYRLNTFLKGDTLEETYQNIAAIYNLKFRTGKKDKPLDRYEIPEQKILAVKERVRMELAHRLHLKAGSANAKKETRE
ncbi:MAG: sigma-70 family RNA polymerase sigma factor, partial [Candidatus Omnitrophota bacterium]